MVFMDVYAHGVMLSRSTGDHRQSVCVGSYEWTRLVELREEITAKVTAGTEGSWKLREKEEGPPSELRATVSLFAGQAYVNIRVYWKDGPTKQGVTMALPEWLNFQTVLSHGRELKICRSTYAALLQENINSTIKKRCGGCSIDDPSQRGHDCVMMASGFVESIIEERVAVDMFDFVERAQRGARLVGVVIQKPLEAYRLCETFYRTEIERSYLVGKM